MLPWPAPKAAGRRIQRRSAPCVQNAGHCCKRGAHTRGSFRLQAGRTSPSHARLEPARPVGVGFSPPDRGIGPDSRPSGAQPSRSCYPPGQLDAVWSSRPDAGAEASGASKCSHASLGTPKQRERSMSRNSLPRESLPLRETRGRPRRLLCPSAWCGVAMGPLWGWSKVPGQKCALW
jgi:hypothetical protein